MLSVSLTLAELGVGFLQSWINFGVVSIASAQVSLLVVYLRLPLIIGYMFFGLIIGPQLCDLITVDDLPHLQYITQFALAFICLSAGAELYLPELKSLFRRILTLTALLTVVTFVLVVIVVYLESQGGWASYTSELPEGISQGGCQFSIALIAAAIMVSQSPASAIAVVREAKAKGPFTSTMLGVTVLIDVVVLLLSSIATSITNSECDPLSDGFRFVDLVLTLATVCLAVFVGWVFGKVIIFLIWLPRVKGEWAVPPLGFAVFQFSTWFLEWTTAVWGHGVNLDALLICIAAGYVVANQSRNRRKFLRFFNRAGPIIFIPFFTLTGAGLKVNVIFQALPFAIITALTRATAFGVSTVVGGRWTGMPARQRNTLWVAMITQAGVSLGIAAEVALSFPAWGGAFQSVIVAVILINQVLGPILCSRMLQYNGEAGLAEEDEDDDERVRRCVLIGMNDDSFALAQRLLNANWDVVFLDTDAERLKLTAALKVPVRRKRSHTAEEPPIVSKVEAEENKDSGAHSTAEDSTGSAGEAAPAVEGDGHEGAAAGEEGAATLQVADMEEHSMNEEVFSSKPPSSDAYVEVEAVREQVTTRLVTPVAVSSKAAMAGISTSVRVSLTESGSARARDSKHEAILLGYEAQMGDVTPANTDAVVIFLPSDSQAFALSNLLLDAFHLTKVIAQVNNPLWASMLANIGVLPIYSFSATVAMLFQAVTSTKGRMEFIRPDKPVHTQLAALIKPDTTDKLPIHLVYSTDEDQADFLRQHPNPPVEAQNLFRFNEKLKVVPDAAREEYINSIYGVHASRSSINTGRNLARGGPHVLRAHDGLRRRQQRRRGRRGEGQGRGSAARGAGRRRLGGGGEEDTRGRRAVTGHTSASLAALHVGRFLPCYKSYTHSSINEQAQVHTERG